jgi:hypothetical protein
VFEFDDRKQEAVEESDEKMTINSVISRDNDLNNNTNNGTYHRNCTRIGDLMTRENHHLISGDMLSTFSHPTFFLQVEKRHS